MITSISSFMMVLLLNPPSPPALQANRDFMGNYGMLSTRPGIVLPPLHLIQMGGTLESRQVQFIDAAAECLDASTTKRRIQAQIPALAIVLTSTATIELDLAMARWIKEETGARTLLYGPHPAHRAKEAFTASGADGILVGYTPDTLSTLLESPTLPQDRPELMLEDLITSPPPVSPRFDMDELPFGCWPLTPLKKYRFDMREPTPFASMRTSLGCVYSCAYCPYVVAEGRRFFAMSPERIYAEMEYLSQDHGVRYILFRDLLFTLQRKRIAELCRLLRKRPLPLTWRAETSTQHLDAELLGEMSAAGCTGMNLGVESVDEESALEMDLVKKRSDLEHLRKVFATCRSLGIRSNALFVIGFPEDSRTGIEKTIAFARTLDAETVQFALAIPFPGTLLADVAAKERLIEETDWAAYSSLKPVMRTRHMSREDVQEWSRKALRSVYLQPTRIVRMARHPWEFVRRVQAFVRYYANH